MFSVLILCAGCAARRPGLSGSTYRLVHEGTKNLLLTPAVSRDGAVELRFPATAGLRRGDAAKCSIKGGLFGLARTGRDWELRLPSARSWSGDDAGAAIQQGFEEFFSQLEITERETCLGPGGSAMAGTLVQESLPAPPADTLYYRYRYRLGDGFVDLGPGMTIKMERAHFRPGTMEKEQTIANYLGTSTVEYEISTDARGRMRFRRGGIVLNPPVLKLGADGIPEAKLAANTRRMPFYRLFVSNEFVPRHFQRAAILIGSPSRSAIEEATRALKTRPDTTCSEAPLAGMDCVAFNGKITVAAELWATVQGQPRHLPVGAMVRWLLGPRPADVQSVPPALRIERLYGGRHVPVEFPPGDKAVLDLPVMGGDRIAW